MVEESLVWTKPSSLSPAQVNDAHVFSQPDCFPRQVQCPAPTYLSLLLLTEPDGPVASRVDARSRAMALSLFLLLYPTTEFWSFVPFSSSGNQSIVFGELTLGDGRAGSMDQFFPVLSRSCTC